MERLAPLKHLLPHLLLDDDIPLPFRAAHQLRHLLVALQEKKRQSLFGEGVVTPE